MMTITKSNSTKIRKLRFLFDRRSMGIKLRKSCHTIRRYVAIECFYHVYIVGLKNNCIDDPARTQKKTDHSRIYFEFIFDPSTEQHFDKTN